VIAEVLYKTLSLVCDLNLVLRNYQAARLAVKDLEVLQRNEANTYLMKLRVLFSQTRAAEMAEGNGTAIIQGLMNEIADALSMLERAENFKFVNLVSVLHDADEQGLSDATFSQLISQVLQYISHNKQAITYSLSQLHLPHSS
jgi:hypothetical protein